LKPAARTGFIASTPMSAYRKVAFVVNATKPGAQELARELEQIAREAGAAVRHIDHFPLPADALLESDLCCCIGGDGTILGSVQALACARIPVLGINRGRLGFMANFPAETVKAEFPAILAGGYPLQHRTLIEFRASDAPPHYALNEVMLRSAESRLIRLSVHSGDKLVNTYNADGLIFSTPTGSTAYNLSAGGPIVHPDAHVFLLTPINPHTLSNRSIVIDAGRAMSVTRGGGREPVRIAADGIEIAASHDPFPLSVRICPDRTIAIMHHHQYSHFEVLRRKLGWSGDTASATAAPPAPPSQIA